MASQYAGVLCLTGVREVRSSERGLSDREWMHLLGQLERNVLSGYPAAHAIVQLEKQWDSDGIHRPSQVVIRYLDNPDSWVRREAIWSCSWGELAEYSPDVRRALVRDPDPDNRAFAATVLRRLYCVTPDAATRRALARVVLDTAEEARVRAGAYEAVLLTAHGQAVGKQFNRLRQSLDPVSRDAASLKAVEWDFVNREAREE